MMLLVTKAEGTLRKYEQLTGYSNLGRLVQPRHYDNLRATVEIGRVWAADNDCFQGLNAVAYKKMVDLLPTEGCRFVTVPDVVGDHQATLALWQDWSGYVKGRGLPAAFVLQDGCRTWDDIPEDVDAIFVGGTTHYKLSCDTQHIIAEAKRRHMWVHMGRVSSRRRIIYAQSIGVDSIDSAAFSRWSDRDIPWALTMMTNGNVQQSLLDSHLACSLRSATERSL